ncbi:MAG: hypothetical protein IKM62_05035 [Kiritimatiellae bacterium]|nr:hypothetical protein [Kiritimatiellia bacterium]
MKLTFNLASGAARCNAKPGRFLCAHNVGRSGVSTSPKSCFNIGGIGAQYRRYRTRVSPMLETYVRG